MKLTRLAVVCSFAVLLLLCACQKSVEMGPLETFDMAGQKISFTPPLDSWGERQITSIPQDENAKNQASNTVISFSPHMPGSGLSISGLPNWSQESWEADQKATDDFTRQIQDQILKRSNGKIIKQRQTELGGAAALELEVSYSEGTQDMHGKQIYAIHNKTMWIVAMNVPEANWKDNAQIYEQIVSSWKF